LASSSSADFTARALANSKTQTYYQNTAPVTPNSNDLWLANTGVLYENFGNTTYPIWAETGPTNLTYTQGGGGVSASGYLNNSVIFANATGYLSNTTNIQFYTSNNNLYVAGTINVSTVSSNSITVNTVTSNTVTTNTVTTNTITSNTITTTGTVTAPQLFVTNGLIMNNQTISNSFVIPAGYSAISVGPLSVANSANVSLGNGARWIII